jgi:hypothetical protein
MDRGSGRGFGNSYPFVQSQEMIKDENLIIGFGIRLRGKSSRVKWSEEFYRFG